jgi:hypothetical protein
MLGGRWAGRPDQFLPRRSTCKRMLCCGFEVLAVGVSVLLPLGELELMRRER